MLKHHTPDLRIVHEPEGGANKESEFYGRLPCMSVEKIDPDAVTCSPPRMIFAAQLCFPPDRRTTALNANLCRSTAMAYAMCGGLRYG